MKLKGLDAFFGSSKVLLIAFILFFVSKVIGFFNMESNNDTFVSVLSIEHLIMALLIFGLFLSYVFHESNIQKSLLSNVYLLQIIQLIEPLLLFKINVEELNLYNFLIISEAILWIVSYVIHLIMLSDKTGKNSKIRLSQIIFLLIFVIEVVTTINILKAMPNIMHVIYANTLIPLFLIVCIDTKIGIYKRTRLELREKGKWDDKAKAVTKKIFNLF